MKKALVVGATGFLGEHVLAAKPPDWEVEVFARAGSDLGRVPPDVRVHRGDLSDPDALRRALKGADALLNIASLGFGHAQGIVDACRSANTPRAVFVGTTAVFTTLPAKSKSVRLEAERILQDSGLAYTLLRPTMIYGTPRDRNIWRLIMLLRWAPVLPVVDGGGNLQQPVFVEDVARACWTVLDRPRTIGQAFNVGGAQALSFAEMAMEILKGLHRRAPLVSVPLQAALAAAAALRRIPFAPRITREQILRLKEDKSFDIQPAAAAFGYAPLSFAQGVDRELKWLS